MVYGIFGIDPYCIFPDKQTPAFEFPMGDREHALYIICKKHQLKLASDKTGGTVAFGSWTTLKKLLNI